MYTAIWQNNFMSPQGYPCEWLAATITWVYMAQGNIKAQPSVNVLVCRLMELFAQHCLQPFSDKDARAHVGDSGFLLVPHWDGPLRQLAEASLSDCLLEGTSASCT